MCTVFDAVLVEWSCKTWSCLCDVSDAVCFASAHKPLPVQFWAHDELTYISSLDDICIHRCCRGCRSWMKASKVFSTHVFSPKSAGKSRSSGSMTTIRCCSNQRLQSVPVDKWQAHVHPLSMQNRKHDHSSRRRQQSDQLPMPVTCCCCCWLHLVGKPESLCSWDWDTCTHTRCGCAATKHVYKARPLS